MNLKKLIKWLLLFSLAALSIYIMATQPPSVATESFYTTANNYKARIIRDDFGVPHIYGKRDADVVFGLAYAHAEDDFTTIQDIILVVRGNFSAKNGATAAVTDYLIQWMGIWDQIESQYESAISTETKAAVDAYASAINLFAAENPDKVNAWLLPVTGQDIVAGFVFKTPLFYGFDKTIANLAEGKLGTGLDKSKSMAFTHQQQLVLGSQGIAINRQRSGEDIVQLLVNSHQPLTGPVAWYEARLKSEQGIDMVGATFPGAPFILNGSGPALGWSSTVNKPDLIDIYKLSINPDNYNQYWMDGIWHNFEQTEATIRIKLVGPLYWTVNEPILRSVHGPVMQFDHGSYALRWAGMDEIRQTNFFHAINRAKTITEFEAALAMNAMPSINYVYADKDNNIAHYYNAMMPKRTHVEGIDWQAILPGDRSDLIWSDYVVATELPRTVNPSSGAVFNANNTPYQSTDGADDPKEKDFPIWMGIEKQMTNRALQINERLTRSEFINRDKFKSIKMDNRYHPKSEPIKTLADFLIEGLPEDLQHEPYQSAFLHLKNWNYSTEIDNRHAALGVLTITPLINQRMFNGPSTTLANNFKLAVDSLHKYHQTIDLPWGDINKHVRGDKTWPMSGGPDLLRAVYGWPISETGILVSKVGDSYIQFANWGKDGSYSVRAINAYGAATTRPTSQHYDDQASLYATGDDRQVAMDLAELLKIATSDKVIGKKFKSE